MAKQTFTTGQILTAAQMTSLQQTAMGGGSVTDKTTSYTLVAADAGTVVQMNSASATTITINTGLFAAGDTVQIQNIGAGICTITPATATVNTAGSLALSQYEGGQLYFNTTSAAIFFDIVQSAGMTNPFTTTGDTIYSSSGTTPARLGIGSTGQVLTVASGVPSWATPAASASGLTLISTTTFSAAASASLPVGTFSSTYDNYKVITTITASTAAGIRYRARIGGVDNTSVADYKYQQISADNTSIAGARQTALGFWNLGSYGTIKTFQTIEISGLFEAAYPQLTSAWIYDPAANAEAYMYFAGLAVTTSYDALTFFPSTGTITGNIKVYGYQK